MLSSSLNKYKRRLFFCMLIYRQHFSETHSLQLKDFAVKGKQSKIEASAQVASSSIIPLYKSFCEDV